MLMCFSTLAIAAPVQEGFTVWSGSVAPFDNVKKPWNIKFNAQVLETDVTGENIYITDVENIVHPASVSLSADGKTVTLNPTKDYTAGSDYRLYIKDQIRDRNGKYLNKAIVMPFKVSASAASLNSNIVISNSGTVETKDNREVILSNPSAPADSMNGHRLAVVPPAPNFEYDIRYVAQVMPVSVDNVMVDGVPQTVTVQANDIFIDQNKAFVSYNYRGAVYAGAVQIIDISDAVHPQILHELKFNNMDINAVYYDNATGYLLFGGGTANVLDTGLTSFVARVDVNNIQVSDIANSLTALPSSCVTSICKKGSEYYVSTGAASGAIIVLDSDMHQVDNRNVNDVRDIDSYDQGFAALAAKFPADSTESTGKLISSLTDSTSDIVLNDFCSTEHKSTIDLLAGLPVEDKILLDEEGIAFMALADEGFRVVKMGGADYSNQVVYELPNPSMANPDADPDTVGVAYDGGLVFLANGDYGFQVLQVKGMVQDPITGVKSIDPAQFAELVGYHELTGSIYDGNYYRANNIAYKKRQIIREGQSVEQNVLFVAVGDGGVNIYTLTNKNDYDNTAIPDATWDGIHQLLPEGQAQDLNGPMITADPNIKLLADAQVNVIFVDEDAAYRNAVGCFVTTLEPSAITSAASIEDGKQMIFPNASKVGSGGTLVRGDSRLLSPNPLPAGSYIGTYFRQNGYDYPDNPQFYTIQALNQDGKGHFAVFVDDVNEKIVIALEDLTNLGDKDFNDVVLILDVKPFAAADISGLPRMSDLLNAISTPSISSLEPISATVALGESYTMPTTVTANMSNGTTSQVSVVWTPASIDTSTAGLKEASGVVSGYSGLAQLQVTVQAPAGSCPDLGKIFAVGVNSDDGKAIELTGSSKIEGDTACNSVAANSVIFCNDSVRINDGDLYIGPGGDAATVVSFSGGGNAATNIPNGSITNLAAVQTFNMPQFPAFPSLDQRDDMNAGWWPIPEGGHRISENGQYSSINVSNQLTIDIGNEDRIIRTGSLNVASGDIILNRTGNGKLILYVDNTLEVTGDGTINQSGDYNALQIYYAGANALSIGGSTAVVASLFAQGANISIDGSGGITGHIITGGNAVNVTGDASANVRAIYAPGASLQLTGSGKTRGAVVANDIKVLGNTRIFYSNQLNTDFFNQLDW